jgi:WD40 repeat protein/beta-lactamase regulating signal transducer with metallopeptidase domain
MASSWLPWFFGADWPALTLAGVAFKATFILICAVVAAAALRRGSAASRHYVWGAALAGALALPLLGGLLPQWKVPVGWTHSATKSVGPEASAALPAGSTATLAGPDRSAMLSPGGPPEAQEAMSDQSLSAGPPAAGATAIEPPTARGAEVETSASEPVTASWDIAEWAAAAWALGAVVVFLFQVRGVAGMGLLCRQARPVDGAGWAALACEIARQSHLRRGIRLLVSHRVEIPMIWGLFRPAVILPEAAQTWSGPRCRAVLLHEVSHIRRRDLLTRHLAQLACAVYWWHPLIWLAARRLYVEGERACDDSVLRAGVRASEYAAHLLEIARAVRARASALSPVAAMAQRSQLRRRVTAILGAHNRRGATPRHAVATLALAGVLVAALAAMKPSLTSEAGSPSGGQGAAPDATGPAKSSPVAPAATGVDLYGDPIPAGARACLGTFRLRHPGWRKAIAFSASGKRLISTSETGVRVWDTASGVLLWSVGRDGLFSRDTPERIAMWGRDLGGFCVSSDGTSIAGLIGRFDPNLRTIRHSIVLLRATAPKPSTPLELMEPETAESSRLCFTPDGSKLVVGHPNGAIHVWDVHPPQLFLKQQLRGKRGGMAALEVSRDGDLVAAVFDGEVYVWPWQSAKEPTRLKLERFDGRAAAMVFSADGKRLAIGSGDPTTIRVWDIQSGRLLETLQGPSIGIYIGGFALTPEGVRLATPGITEKKVFLWDMRTGKPVQQFDTDPFEPERVAMSRDGQLLAAVPATAARIQVWNLKTGEEVAQNGIGHEDWVADLAFSPDGKRVVTASADGTVRTWDAERGLQELLLRHDNTVRGVAVSPDGKWIASNSTDNAVRLWDAATGHEVRRLPGHGRLGGQRPIAFSRDGRRLATWGDGDLKLHVWDVAAGKTIHEWEVPPADVREAQMAVFGRRPTPEVPASSRLWTSSDIGHAQFSPDGSLLVLAMIRGVYLFDVETGKQVQMISATRILRSAAVAPDGKRLALAEDGFPAAPSWISVYELPSGKEIWRQEFPEQGPSQMSFSADGRLLAAATRQPIGQIRILDAATGGVLHTIGPVPAPSGATLRFSPDGKSLSCGTADGAVLLWDVPLGR